MTQAKYVHSGLLRPRIVARGLLAAAATLLVAIHSGCELPEQLGEYFERVAPKSTPKPQHSTTEIETNIINRLKDLETRDEDIRTQFYLEDTLKQIFAKVPKGRPIEWVVWYMSQSIEGTRYRVVDSYHDERKNTCSIWLRSDEKMKLKLLLVLRESNRYMSNSGKIAIVREDFDFQANQTTIDILSYPHPLTVSLDPSQSKSGWAAQAANEYNKEILIRLPMEPVVLRQSMKKYQKHMIMVHHPSDKIRNTIEETTKAVPNFAGFANRYGSRTLEDSRVIGIVLEEIKNSHAYFLETGKPRSSLLKKMAKKEGVPYAAVNTKISNGNASTMEGELRHACIVAHKTGSVQISAKASQALVQALKSAQSAFKQNGIRLVYVSEIVQHPKEK